MKLAPIRMLIARELLERAALAKLVAARWVLTGDHKDRVRASTIAEYVAAQQGFLLSNESRRRVARAVELAGFRRRVNVHSVYWVTNIKERTR